MPKAFYKEEDVKESYNLIMALKSELKGNFVVIGGWAVYNYTGIQKSKDIDIFANRESLDLLGKIYNF